MQMCVAVISPSCILILKDPSLLYCQAVNGYLQIQVTPRKKKNAEVWDFP